MKVLSKLIGKVCTFNLTSDYSHVTLKNVDTGEIVDSNAVTEKLLKAGITKIDDEFEVIIFEDDNGKQTGCVTKLEPKKLAKETSAVIVKEVDDKLDTSPCYEI